MGERLTHRVLESAWQNHRQWLRKAAARMRPRGRDARFAAKGYVCVAWRRRRGRRAGAPSARTNAGRAQRAASKPMNRDFRSDNVAPAHPAILQALLAANGGAAAPYGADAHSARVTE